MNLTRKQQLITELTQAQQTFVNELVSNGGDKIKAYGIAYSGANQAYAPQNSYHVMENEKVQEYYVLLQQAHFAKYRITRQDLQAMHMKTIKSYERLQFLLEKPNKTETDYMDIQAYKGFVRLSDVKNALKEIALLNGHYAPNRTETDIKQTIKIITSNSNDYSSNIIVDLPSQPTEAEDISNILLDLPQNTLLEQSDPNNGIQLPLEGDNASNEPEMGKNGSNKDNKDDGNEMPF